VNRVGNGWREDSHSQAADPPWGLAAGNKIDPNLGHAVHPRQSQLSELPRQRNAANPFGRGNRGLSERPEQPALDLLTDNARVHNPPAVHGCDQSVNLDPLVAPD
jgi:hypothetical protein